LRIVADTNVLISAFCFPGGIPEQVYRLAVEGPIELVTSKPILAEFGRVLADKIGWEPGRVEEAVAHIARIATVVQPSEEVHVVENDPDDDRVLEAAIAGYVEIIVSGDSHLLKLGAWRGIRITSPAQFVESLE